MRLKFLVAALACLAAITVQAATARMVVIQTSDTATYVQAIAKGQALLKSKGSPAVLRVWRAQYAGDKTGSIVVSVEYPDLAALAKDNTMMATDPDLKAWLQSLDKLRTVQSDGIYQELKP
jgi:hypothetical protein